MPPAPQVTSCVGWTGSIWPGEPKLIQLPTPATRTTIDLDPTVLGELWLRGQREGKSMGQVASELLARALARKADPKRPAFEWLRRDLGRPLVDLEDKEAVRAILDKKA